MTSPEFSVALHIGVHKTATSHLQRSLEKAADGLVANGVRYYGPDHFRLPGRSLSALFGLKRNARHRRAPVDQLMLLRKGATRLVLSEENFIGALNTPRRQVATLRYPKAGPRISALSQALDCGGLDVFMAVRHPATYLNSAYGQMLMGGRVMPFAQFQQLNPVAGVNWLDLVMRIRRAPGVNRLTVWRYEDYADVFRQIVTGLVGDAQGKLVTPLPKRVHVGLSAAAVAAVQCGDAHKTARELAKAARRDMPVGADYAAFDGVAEAAYDQADQEYDAQVAQIRALRDVIWLQPVSRS